jgi:hypothetical protein
MIELQLKPQKQQQSGKQQRNLDVYRKKSPIILPINYGLFRSPLVAQVEQSKKLLSNSPPNVNT